VTQGVGPELKPQYCKQTNKKTKINFRKNLFKLKSGRKFIIEPAKMFRHIFCCLFSCQTETLMASFSGRLVTGGTEACFASLDHKGSFQAFLAAASGIYTFFFWWY
jgi:hypothetical protein